ncbi:MAG: hypothetical protein KAI27_06340, partial [Rhodospirillaceae bacterium]|nr:hypothetical protein [Rhodospirillaceae bacterium]
MCHGKDPSLLFSIIWAFFSFFFSTLQRLTGGKIFYGDYRIFFNLVRLDKYNIYNTTTRHDAHQARVKLRPIYGGMRHYVVLLQKVRGISAMCGAQLTGVIK